MTTRKKKFIYNTLNVGERVMVERKEFLGIGLICFYGSINRNGEEEIMVGIKFDRPVGNLNMILFFK